MFFLTFCSVFFYLYVHIVSLLVSGVLLWNSAFSCVSATFSDKQVISLHSGIWAALSHVRNQIDRNHLFINFSKLMCMIIAYAEKHFEPMTLKFLKFLLDGIL